MPVDLQRYMSSIQQLMMSMAWCVRPAPSVFVVFVHFVSIPNKAFFSNGTTSCIRLHFVCLRECFVLYYSGTCVDAKCKASTSAIVHSTAWHISNNMHNVSVCVFFFIA